MREPAVAPEVEIHEVVCRGRSPVQPAAGPFSLKIGRGEFFSIIGPEYAAGSSLLRVIAGLERPVSGTVIIEGDKVQRPRAGLGMVFQESSLLEWRSLLRNVLLQIEIRGMDPGPHEARARALLAAMGMSGLENSLPGSMPLGRAQRVSICRALMHGPSLLLMDDPFRGLDGLDREQLAIDLQRMMLTPRLTVILSTTAITEAIQLSDRIAVVAADGRILQNVSIDLSRPRRMDKATAPQITEYCSTIRMALHGGGLLS